MTASMHNPVLPRLIILHCFGKTSRDRWYRSVGNAVTDIFDIVLPDLPNPDTGRMSEWLPVLQALKPDQQTVLVGHSLGGLLILRYLETATEPVAGFYTVAAPIGTLDRDDLLETGFFDRELGWEAIKHNANRRFIIASTDDATVPFEQAQEIAKRVDGELIQFSDKGHFKQDDFPELITRLRTDW